MGKDWDGIKKNLRMHLGLFLGLLKRWVEYIEILLSQFSQNYTMSYEEQP